MRDNFIKDWMGLPDKDPDKLSKYAVKNDYWDRKLYERLLGEINQFIADHDRLHLFLL